MAFIRVIPLLILLLFLALFPSPSLALIYVSTPNSTFLPLSSSSSASASDDSSASSLLREIVDAIAAKERWDAKDGVRVSDLDRGGVRARSARRYEVRGRVGRTTVAATFSDEAAGWRRVRERGDGVVVVEEGEDSVGGDGAVGLGLGLGLGAAITDFELVGPLDLRVGGGDDNEIALHYPLLNTTNVGLKRLLVGEGIKIKVVAKVTAATEVKFRIELEKNLTENDRTWKKIPAWKTKPRVDRVWLEVVARVEEGGQLKAVLLKKLGRSFSIDDSTAWSKMMSNVSFTQFPSFVVHPKALTLDVKW
uniref:Uncharacterized protein n=1 Tax=Puya raimondii TaxID=112807 RepID=A0A8A0WGX6_PUYRA|nr:hypothetical protein PY_002815 [Puya raimondii]